MSPCQGRPFDSSCLPDLPTSLHPSLPALLKPFYIHWCQSLIIFSSSAPCTPLSHTHTDNEYLLYVISNLYTSVWLSKSSLSLLILVFCFLLLPSDKSPHCLNLLWHCTSTFCLPGYNLPLLECPPLLCLPLQLLLPSSSGLTSTKPSPSVYSSALLIHLV